MSEPAAQPFSTIYVCTTCQRSDVARQVDEPRSGEILHAALQASPTRHRIEPVACMNNCVNGCTVAFSAEGKWTYVFGNVDPLVHAADVLALADVHAATVDGQVNWGRRPEALKRNSVSRVPPLLSLKSA